MDTISGKVRIATVKRISGATRQRKGLSFKTQADECHEFALAHNGVIVHELSWSKSSWHMTQADYDELIGLAKDRKIDAVLMFRMDRFGRNNGLAIERCDTLAHKYGIQIWSKEEGINLDKDRRDAALTRAAQESIAISQRVLPNMRELANNGLWTGSIPFGYISDKSHLDEDGEILRGYIKPQYPHADVLREMFAMVDSDSTVYAVTAWLNDHHAHLSKDGWRIQTVLAILRNPVYIGRVVYDRQCKSKFAPNGPKDKSRLINVKGKHEPIVDEDVFMRVQQKLAVHAYRRSRSEKSATRGNMTPIRNLVHCGVCGRTLHLNLTYRNGKPGFGDNPLGGATFRCTIRGHASLSLKKVQAHVLSEVRRIVMRPDALEVARKQLESVRAVVPLNKRQRLQNDYDQWRQAYDNIGDKLALGVIDDAEYVRLSERIKAKLAEIDALIRQTPNVVDVKARYKEAEKYIVGLQTGAALIDRALSSNDQSQVDDVAEALSYAINAVHVHKDQEPVIEWKPWVGLLTGEPVEGGSVTVSQPA